MKRMIFAVLLLVSDCGGPGAPTYTYDDIKQPHGRDRSDAALQRATAFCDARATRAVNAPAFDQCMLGRGWRYSHTVAGKSPWCYAGVYNCAGDDTACLADEKNLEKTYDLCPDVITDPAPAAR
jgi:hypothetical protein